MPFQTDRLSHWSVTSTDRVQGSVCVCVHVRPGVRWTEPGIVQICPPSQQLQEELIPSKALEAEVRVVSADLKCISFRAISGAEENLVNTLPVSPQVPSACHIYLVAVMAFTITSWNHLKCHHLLLVLNWPSDVVLMLYFLCQPTLETLSISLQGCQPHI